MQILFNMLWSGVISILAFMLPHSQGFSQAMSGSLSQMIGYILQWGVVIPWGIVFNILSFIFYFESTVLLFRFVLFVISQVPRLIEATAKAASFTGTAVVSAVGWIAGLFL
jgi:hypothetical protein